MAQAFVDGKISGKRVVIFSKSYCPFCKKAKAAFQKYKTALSGDYEEVEIENDPQCQAIQKYLQKLTGASSVPRVFIDQNFVGGGDDIARMASTGELEKKLNLKKG